MSGINSAISTALTGLEAYEEGINTVSNNLANATTSGYSVESLNSSEIAGTQGQPGDGVDTTVVRAVSSFAASQLRAANSQSGAASALSTQLTNISNSLTNNGDVETAMNTFFNDFSNLASNPGSAAEGATVLSDGQAVVSSFQSASASVSAVSSSALSSLTNNVQSANSYLQQLATINKSLIASPNNSSLLDEQQNVMNSLSSLISFSTITQANGSVMLNTNGTVLLDQGGAATISVNQASDTSTPVLTVSNDSLPMTVDSTDGSIGGAIASWKSAQTASQNLDNLATIFSSTINTAQAQGLTSLGVSGGNMFSVPNSTVVASPSNSGTASIGVSGIDQTQLPPSGGPYTLTYGSSGWSATDTQSGSKYTISGTPPSFAGIALNISGSPNVGDSFTLNTSPGAATDISLTISNPENIAAADPYVGTAGTLQSDGSIKDLNAGTITTGKDVVTTTPSSNAGVVPSSYYGQDLQITFTSPTSYNITTAADPNTVISSGSFSSTGGGNLAVAYPSTGASSGQYWEISLSGSPAAGDTMTFEPGGSSSGSNASRIASLWSDTSTTTSGSLQSTVASLSSSLGANSQAAQNEATATGDQVTSATTNLQTVSGVNTDSQAVDLTDYEQAYQAAAKAISAANSMFQSLLSAV